LCSDANISRLEETRRARVPHSFRQDMRFAPQLEWQSFNLAFTFVLQLFEQVSGIKYRFLYLYVISYMDLPELPMVLSTKSY
jgi:hypothetical protein